MKQIKFLIISERLTVFMYPHQVLIFWPNLLITKSSMCRFILYNQITYHIDPFYGAIKQTQNSQTRALLRQNHSSALSRPHNYRFESDQNRCARLISQQSPHATIGRQVQCTSVSR